MLACPSREYVFDTARNSIIHVNIEYHVVYPHPVVSPQVSNQGETPIASLTGVLPRPTSGPSQHRNTRSPPPPHPPPHRRLTHKSKGKGLRKPGGQFTSYPGRIHTDSYMAKNVSPRRRPKQTEGTPLCPSTPPFLLIVQSVKAQRPTHLDAQALSATCS